MAAPIKDVVAVWQGGLTMFGGFFGGLLLGLWYMRRNGFSIVQTLDADLNLTSEGGTLQTQSTSIGNSRGPGTVGVGSAVWYSAGTITVGSGGLGSVIINNGGVVTTASVVLGASSAGVGSVIIGSGGSLTAMIGSTAPSYRTARHAQPPVIGSSISVP